MRENITLLENPNNELDDYELEEYKPRRKSNPTQEDIFPGVALLVLAGIGIFIYKQVKNKFPWQGIALGQGRNRRQELVPFISPFATTRIVTNVSRPRMLPSRPLPTNSAYQGIGRPVVSLPSANGSNEILCSTY